ncbi:MAG: hypothetical protein U0869_05025 [Chloroflexota bacterium]
MELTITMLPPRPAAIIRAAASGVKEVAGQVRVDDVVPGRQRDVLGVRPRAG